MNRAMPPQEEYCKIVSKCVSIELILVHSSLSDVVSFCERTWREAGVGRGGLSAKRCKELSTRQGWIRARHSA